MKCFKNHVPFTVKKQDYSDWTAASASICSRNQVFEPKSVAIVMAVEWEQSHEVRF